MQTLVWGLLIILGCVTIALNGPELKRALNTLSDARLAYLPVLVLVQILFVLNMGLFYSSAFRAAGLKASTSRFFLVSAAGYFINLVSKSSGFGALALYMKEGERSGDSAVRVAAAFMVAYVLNYSAYISVLVAALAILAIEGSLTLAEAIASAVLLVFLAGVAVVIVAGFRSQHNLHRILQVLFAPLNWMAGLVIHRPLIHPESLEASAAEFFEAVHLMARHPARFFLPFLYALGVELVGVVTLYAVAHALHANVSLGVAFAGYALSTLASILSITPAGLGFVEASLAVFLVSNGLSRPEALAVTLGYRVFEFWLPVAVGAVSALYLRLARSEGQA